MNITDMETKRKKKKMKMVERAKKVLPAEREILEIKRRRNTLRIPTPTGTASINDALPNPLDNAKLMEYIKGTIDFDALQDEFVDYCIAKAEASDSRGKRTKYCPDIVVEIVALLACGMSKVSLCNYTPVYLSDISFWKKKFPEFAKAYEIGEQLYASWWENLGYANSGNKEFNNALYMFNMQNRFKGKWFKNVSSGGAKTIVNIDNREQTQNTINVNLEDRLKSLTKKELKVLRRLSAKPQLVEAEIIED